ncbi:MAG: M3 family metallopeptidase, partial [Pseudomonadota bacterium]
LLDAGAHTWDSLLVPMEQMHHRLDRVWSPVGHLNAVMNNDALRKAYNACLPLLSDYSTEVGQNERLYAAYRQVAEDSADDLNPAQAEVLRQALRDFRLAGVGLDGEAKRRYGEIMSELSALQAKFEENLLDCANAWSRHVTDEAELAGLPDNALARAREEAARRELDGWVFTLDFPAYQAVITRADSRELRREFYTAWVTRASDQGPHDAKYDNADAMRSILRLRAEVAALLGFDSFVDYSLATKMARNPGEVSDFLNDLARRSVPAAKAEFAELEHWAGRPLEAWDVAYYAEKLRQERLGISQEELRPWFPVDKAMAGLFAVAERLFGISITEQSDVDVWHDDARFYRITDGDGKLVGQFYTDLYARRHKRGGAWMDECVGRMQLGEPLMHPVAYLVCNFMPPGSDKPGLLTHDEVVTLFHEFGHTLHHLLTRVDYPSVSGINGVPWDAVELPSQFMENFAWEHEVLPLISAHFETGKPLPDELFERLLGTRQFQAGLQMVRQLEFALFDLRVHAESSADEAADVHAALAAVRAQVSVLPTPAFNRFPNGFSHIFGGGYAAGYYSYKWAEVLSADAYSLFEENGVLHTDSGIRFLNEILARGGTRDAMEAFVAFRGREPELDALLRHSGLQTDAA